MGSVTKLEVPPPSDVDREAVVLSTCLCIPEAFERARELVDTRHFYSNVHRWIWTAMLECGPELEHVARWLKDHERLEQVGGTPYLLRLFNEVPTRLPVEAECAELGQLSERRRLIAELQQATALARGGEIEGAWETLRALEKPPERDAVARVLGPADIFAPLAPVRWAVQALRIAPGAPVMVAGEGYSGKTLAWSSLLLSLATGAPIWGKYKCEPRRVIHVDYEQGSRLTFRKYQQLAVGLGVTVEDIGDRIALVSMEELWLDQDDAETVWGKLAEGRELMLIDSFAAAMSRTEENSVEARRPLDMLTRISERTGCAFVVLHHNRKDQQGGVNSGQQIIRGSGAINQACGGIFQMKGGKGEPKRVTHTKERLEGAELEDFELHVTDLYDEESGETKVGVTVVAHDVPATDSVEQRFEQDAIRLFAVVKKNPGIGVRKLRELAGGKPTRVRAMLDHLVDTGKVTVGAGERGSQKFTAAVNNFDPWQGGADDD